MDIDEYNERAIKWLSDHWRTGLLCPACGDNHWNLLSMAESPLRQEMGEQFRGKAIPLIPFFCTT
jgi:hypothetical protein